jgi:hypothetical protein
MNIEFIITRYREYIDWIQFIPKHVNKIYIYNKGDNSNLFKSYIPDEDMVAKLEIIPLDNIGRIDHTLVYHILNHYTELPDLLVNLPGTVMMSERKGRYFTMIARRLNKIITNYKGFYAPRFFKVSNNYNYNINDYVPEGICNRNGNPLIKSTYVDFQDWKVSVVDSRPIKYVCMRGMFAVGRDNILHIDKALYERLLESLSVGDNIENGHFAERIWAHLFRQYSFDNFVLPVKELAASPQPEVKVEVLVK